MAVRLLYGLDDESHGGEFGTVEMVVPISIDRRFRSSASHQAVIIIYGAFSIRDKPTARTTWGPLILAFSLISLLSLGRFLFRAITPHTRSILAMVGNR